MPKPIVKISSVVINTTNPQQLSEFWMRLLDVEIARQVPGGFFIWLKPQQPGGISLTFQQVESPTPGPNRLHLDFAVPDLPAARTEILGLGGSLIAEEEVMGFAWNVLADPEGNEFCVAVAPAH